MHTCSSKCPQKGLKLGTLTQDIECTNHDATGPPTQVLGGGGGVADDWCIKPRPNDRNMPTQHVATLLGVTCCVRLATML